MKYNNDPLVDIMMFLHCLVFWAKMIVYGSLEEKTAYFYSLLLVNISGLIINFLAVFMFLRFRCELLSSNNNKLLFSMAFADLLVCIFGIAGAFLIPSNTTGNVSFKRWKLAGLLPLFGSCFISILALVLMSLDRLIAVVYALRYHLIMTDLRINVLISLTWIISILILIIQGVTFLFISPELELEVRSYLLAIFFVAGAIALSIVNVRLYLVIHRKRRQTVIELKSVDLDITRWRRATSIPQKENVSNSFICIWMTAIYFVCWLPVTVYYILHQNGYPGSRIFVTIVMCLASANSLLNPVIYLIKRKAFRKRFARFH